MMRIDHLLHADPALRQHASLPEMDPLTEDDALQDAQVLDVRFDALSGVVGILFELRRALQLQEANTGVLVGQRVRELRWSGPARDTALMHTETRHFWRAVFAFQGGDPALVRLLLEAGQIRIVRTTAIGLLGIWRSHSTALGCARCCSSRG